MILEEKATDFIEDLSSAKPVPGGGGACAAVGAFAAALGMMVANLTVGKKRYADVEEEIQENLCRLKGLQTELIALTDKDAQCFEPLSRAYGLPKETGEEKARKEQVLEKALYEASIVPLELMEIILKTMECLEILGEKGSRLAVSDVGVGILFAQAALEGASLNVYINTKLMKNRGQAQELNRKADALIRQGSGFRERIYAGVLEKVRS